MRQLRSVLRFILFVTSTLGLYVAWFLLNPFVRNKLYWRQIIFESWTRSFAWIAGMTVEIIGSVPEPPFFLVCNHLSYVDIGAIRSVARGVFVAKSEIKGWFLAGPIVRDMGAVFIDRTNRRDIPRAGAEIVERLDQGEGVVVFPEGTSTKGEDVLPFNSSFLQFAAKSGLPVSYAAITYRTPDGEQPANRMVCWWEDIGFVPHILRLFQVKRFTAVINFGDAPVMNTDRKLLACELRERVKELFVPVS
ncbi:MAG: lysophospholipid acyltransferase family protein [Pyrinomonadaceae bacterium]